MNDLPYLGVREEEDVLQMNDALPRCFRQDPEKAVESARVQRKLLESQGHKCFDPDTEDYSATHAIIYGDDGNASWVKQNPREEMKATTSNTAVTITLPHQRKTRERQATPPLDEDFNEDFDPHSTASQEKYDPRTHADDEDCSPMKRRKIDEEWRRLEKYREDVLADIHKARGELASTLVQVGDALRKVGVSLMPPPPSYTQATSQPVTKTSQWSHTSILDVINQPRPKPQPRPNDLSLQPQSQDAPKQPPPQPQPQSPRQPQPQPQTPRSTEIPPPPEGWSQREWNSRLKNVKRNLKWKLLNEKYEPRT